MCGIGAILRSTPAGATPPPPEVSIPDAWLNLIDDSIAHRGPDGTGRFRDRVRRADGSIVDVALVHRRMSIIDIADGTQPMVSERGRAGRGEGLVAVVFNGCIYNHRELRRELQAAGHAFTTDHSDTEVLIHGWREWGTKLPTMLEGMFAFAIWDRARHTFFSARDLYGEKPLYVLEDGGITAFASTYAALRRLPLATPAPTDPDDDVRTVREWLEHGYSSVPPRGVPREAFSGEWRVAGIEQAEEVEPVFAPRPLRPDRSARFGGVDPPAPGGLTPETIDRLLRQAVARRVESDVPLGCFLSGGVDSSLISLFAKETLGQVRTFSVRMPDKRYDESGVAAAVAAKIGTQHTTLECHPDPAADLVMLIGQLGLPFGDSSLLPTYWVSRAAREHVKVALTGDGGDELFVGYERYMAYWVMRRYGVLLSLLPPGLFGASDPSSKPAKMRRLVEAAHGVGATELGAIFGPAQIQELLQGTRYPVWPDPVKGTVLRLIDAKGSAVHGFRRVLYQGLDYLRGDLLRKVDTASMAVALECRAPFLDSDLAAAVHAANPMDLIPGGKRKGLLRQVARRYFSAEVVDRPKMGFAIPIGEWFRSDYGGMKTLLMDQLGSAEPWGPASLGIHFNMNYVRRMVDEHMSGKRDHSQRLYMLLVLSIWARGEGERH